jgi:hypothetical protein
MGWFSSLIRELIVEIERPRPVKGALAPPRRLDHRTVRPDNTPLYLKRGWTKKGNTYHGYYRTKHGAWRGEIERRGDKFKVFIFRPPEERIRKHRRWPCFHDEGGCRWRIQLAVNPKDGDVGAIIFYVEKVIVESFRL